jgi:hypothetical protein
MANFGLNLHDHLAIHIHLPKGAEPYRLQTTCQVFGVNSLISGLQL